MDGMDQFILFNLLIFLGNNCTVKQL